MEGRAGRQAVTYSVMMVGVQMGFNPSLSDSHEEQQKKNIKKFTKSLHTSNIACFSCHHLCHLSSLLTETDCVSCDDPGRGT